MVAKLDNAGLRALLGSPNWREFAQSLADGLGISLCIYRGRERVITWGKGCAWCPESEGGRQACGGYLPRAVGVLGEPVVVTCQQGVYHAVCHLAGEQVLDVVYRGLVAGSPAAAAADSELPEISTEELQAKARSVRTIIAGFVMAYFAATAWGLRGLEMAAIQEISHTVIMLLKPGNTAPDRALDLILNCIMILLDADGCWLATCNGLIMTRGDVKTVHDLLDGTRHLPPGALEVPIGPEGEQGRLGVLYPADREWAEEVLAQLADQAQIVLEVDRLHRTTQKQVAILLEAMGSPVLVTDTAGRITFANSSAERFLERPAPELYGLEAEAVLPALVGAVGYTLSTFRRYRAVGPVTRPGGAVAQVECGTSPLLDGGRLAGCLVVIREGPDVLNPRQQLLVVAGQDLVRRLSDATDNQGGPYVTSPPDAARAGDWIARQRPQAVVIDLRCTRDWVAVARAARRAVPAAHIVLLTEPDSRAELAQARALGITSHLEHPVDPLAVLALVGSLLSPGHGGPG